MSSINGVEILTEFKKQLVNFFDELIDQFPSESDLIVVRVFLKDQVPITDVLSYIIRELLRLQYLVQTKNEDFFLKNNILFSQIDKNKVNHFKRLWRSEQLDNDDKAVIWTWFSSFISLTERYQKIAQQEHSQ
jgi:hypothetical protein